MNIETIKILQQKLEIIMSKGWVFVPRRGYGEIGMLFENELGIENNDFPVADFGGIEIKVQKNNTRFPMTLFSNTCDGPDFFELKRIVKKYGVIDKNFHIEKSLFIRLNAKTYTYWGNYLKMKLYVDWKRQRVYIMIAHANGKIIEKRAYWDFDTLRKDLERKLQFLCYISVDSRYSHGMCLVRCINFTFYKYKSFEKFLELLSEGKILVDIKCGVYKTGPKAGKPYDHGTGFQIDKVYLNELYDTLDISNANSIRC